ncbi:IPP transferase [Arabidopsis thaliana x Arabidopsis arenosa]|uniref:adenylate dimethylallyltransferase (ADP/ATP-dependent) n=1 Tax=Arabidopsis thaliana x Arabidopsis arenosa TaxID=1240361 RepID=A0A8T2B071_9BRAS|nr:IPP transferase [Arabidopsis thaliana x Arabidopsis arenosa]
MKFSISTLKQVQPILSFKNKLSKVNVNSFLHPKEKVVFVMGATGSGKSRLAIDLATRFQGEIINSDKIQLYKGLDVLTNKVTPKECRGVPHHLLGVFDSEAGNITATEYSRLASQEISKLSANNKLPIVAGGSNSYIEALANHSSGFLLNNYDCCFIWVDVSLPVLNSFVSKRVDRMMEAGLLEEVREVFNPKANYSVGIRRAIGVPELHEYLRNESLVDRATQSKMLEVAVKNIKKNTEILACRQLKKIQRLHKKWKLSMHRVDATEVFLKRNVEEQDEAWENLVARPSERIVDKFYNNNQLKNDDVEHCLAASYGGGSSGSRAHNMI